ncbi:hypothetical protein [Knoellia subterranea]|uniref:Secreted protein n=1 Tax=Knoellia subterranea KCTC 19937 TaxID=1385521 RepID=A0A0A0JT80_9MICO|nr:hypothetical protein [Knoellia subterranea]KGN38856.1 hypothetical protein N803_06720 [Knoellia subterranea KCTC 19937]
MNRYAILCVVGLLTACGTATSAADGGGTETKTASSLVAEIDCGSVTLGQGDGDIDSSADRYAGDKLTRVSCGRVTALPDPLRCDPIEG